VSSWKPARAVLLHVNGVDKPGVTHSLTAVLASHNARVLDIGQAVIHKTLALGILVELDEDMKSSTMLADLFLTSQELGVELRFSLVPGGEYQAWVTEQERRRYLITLLAPAITSLHLSEVSRIVSRIGLNIDRIDRLSGRAPLNSDHWPQRACVELAVSGELSDEEHLRGALMRLTEDHDLDIAVQHDDVYHWNRRLVAFDMDSTLIRVEVIDELARLAGVGAEVAAITESAMRGEMDFRKSFVQRVSLLAGLPESALAALASSVPLMDGVERLTGTLKSLGYKMAILSGGFSFMGRELQRRFGIDYLYANELEMRDGFVTGCVSTEIIDGPRKAALRREIAARENFSMEQVIAVGDGANDLPMLSIAGLGIAFRAKPIVRGSARLSISRLGLDGILYLLGLRDRESGRVQVGQSI
jgi:phosphoserine phosphatase